MIAADPIIAAMLAGALMAAALIFGTQLLLLVLFAGLVRRVARHVWRRFIEEYRRTMGVL